MNRTRTVCFDYTGRILNFKGEDAENLENSGIYPVRGAQSSSIARIFSSVTGEMTPFSVMIPAIYVAGVTSNAGL